MPTLRTKCLELIAARCTQVSHANLLDENNFNTLQASLSSLAPELVDEVYLNLVTHNKVNETCLHLLQQSKITYMDLSAAHLSDGAILLMLKAPQSCLQSLRFDNRPLSQALVNVITSAPLCEQLESLYLRNCALETAQVRQILLACPDLQICDLSANAFDDDAFDFETSQTTPGKRARSDMDDSTSPTKKRKLGEDLAITLTTTPASPSVRKMFRLAVSGSKLTHVGLARAAKAYPCLEDVDCSFSARLHSIAGLIQFCPDLTNLNIEGCPIRSGFSDEDMQDDQPILPNLQSLKFSGRGVMDLGFARWFASCAHSLHTLEIRNKHLEDPAVLAQWLHTCTSLTRLDLYGVNASNLMWLQKSTDALVHLDLTNCSGLANLEELASLAAQGLPNLHFLGVSLDKNPPIASLVEVGQHCTQLQHLTVASLHAKGRVKQIEVGQLLATFRQITTLELRCCQNVSFALVNFIPQMCPNLTQVMLCSPKQMWAQSPWLTEAQLNYIQATYPRIDFKMWKQSAKGARFFQHIPSLAETTSRQLMESEIQFQVHTDAHNHPTVELKIDSLPIWSNEARVAIKTLYSTMQSSNWGAVPIVREWCCDCNMDQFDGVLLYEEDRYVVWEISAPGAPKRFKFDKSKLNTLITDTYNTWKRFKDLQGNRSERVLNMQPNHVPFRQPQLFPVG